MIFYHGLDVEVKNPKIIKSEKGRDFGCVFYLTPIKKENALQRLKFQKINSQVAFCSEDSLKLIKFANSYEVIK